MPRDEQILLMEEAHVAQVAAIEAECFSEPWSENAFASELKNPNAITLVALCAGRVVGFVNTGFVLDEVSINNVAVTAAFRGQGIARRLLLSLEDWVREFAAVLLLEVRESNTPARALYRSLDYEDVGRRARYYHNPDEAAILMTKFLQKPNT